MGWLFLGFAACALGAALTVVRPPRAPPLLALIGFFVGWLTGELTPILLIVEAAATVIFAAVGGLASWPGRVGGLVLGLSWVLLLVAFRRAPRIGEAFEHALANGLGDDFEELIPPAERSRIGAAGPGAAWLPFGGARPDLERRRDIPYHIEGRLRLTLDVWRSRSPTEPSARAPALVYVHGGAWVLGDKDHQGLPLMKHLAERGWVCFGINYRLSPRATFPAQLVDVKRAIAWVRAHAEEHRIDPGFLVVAGGSAGGHLASLAALTPGDPEYQPGFESADTRVSGCVSIYGVYDFADRHGHERNDGLLKLLEEKVLKARRADAPAAFDRASPIARLSPSAPPFLVVHGELDSLVPVASARSFVAAFRERCAAEMVYVEAPGAQHAFEVFPSLRTAHFLDGTTRFLGWLYARYVARAKTPPPPV